MNSNPHLERTNRLGRLPVEEAKQDDPVRSDDGQRLYRAQLHDVMTPKGPAKSLTLVRDVPKVRGKKARAAEKVARRMLKASVK